MPVARFKSITISTETYEKLETLAKEDKRSLHQEVDYLIDLENQRRNTIAINV
jgi:predicted CopG family antitoxin